MSVVPTPQSALRRQLGLLAVTALVVGEVIAIGIFLTPAGMARALGSPFWLLIVWLLMGVMALSGALCYGELAARTPEAGGGYVYLREAYGPAVAFLYGWKCMLVMDPGITAVLVLAAVNRLGLRLGSGLMQWLTALKLGALGLIAVLALVMRAGQWSNFVPFVAQRAGSEPPPGALAPALGGASAPGRGSEPARCATNGTKFDHWPARITRASTAIRPSAPSLSAVSHCISPDPSLRPRPLTAASTRIVPIAMSLSDTPARPNAAPT